jgi:hypothetical protein
MIAISGATLRESNTGTRGRVLKISYLLFMKHLCPLIHNGTIKIFSDLLDHVSVDELATAMGCGVKQVEAVGNNYQLGTGGAKKKSLSFLGGLLFI